MLTNETIEDWNATLLLKYGRLNDKPKYRVGYTSTSFEDRWVEGTEYFGPIKLRDVKGIQRMPKYPRDKDRYVLEILVEIPLALKDELVGENGMTYEPLFIFKKGKQYIEPNWIMINMLAYLSHNPIESVVDVEGELAKLDKQDYERLYELLDNEMPDMAMKLKRGSAVSFGGVKPYLIN